MTAEALLAELLSSGVQLWAEDATLRYRAARGVLDARARDALEQHKKALLRLLGQRRRHAPASFAQEQLWLDQQLLGGVGVYNVPLARELRGALDRPALRRALGHLGRRHEALCTTFVRLGDKTLAQIAALDPPAARLAVVDLGALPAGRRRGEARRRAAAVSRRPFDLERGPLWRAGVFVLGERHHHLLLVLHHLIVDGRSSAVLLRELGAFYGRTRAGAPLALPTLDASYADFAAAQRARLAGRFERQLAYWRRRLAPPLPALELGADRPRAVARQRGAVVPLRLSAARVRTLEGLARRHRVSLFTLLLAAFMTLLHRLSGEDDVIVGAPVDGRGEQGLEGLVGYFANTVALRGDLAGDPPFARLLERLRGMVLGALAHQELPFSHLVRELRGTGGLDGRNPLFRVMLVANAGGGPPPVFPGLEVSSLAIDPGHARFDLTLGLDLDAPDLDGWLEYDADRFDRVTIARFGRQLEALLADVVRRPSCPIGELALLAPGERHQLAVEWADGGRWPGGTDVVTRIFEHAAHAPEAPALIGRDGAVTSYRRLIARVSRLAGELRRRGVGPETRVAVFFDRREPAITTLLAILRAGGVYVPLAPAEPAARIAARLADADPLLVVTRRDLVEHLPREESGRPAILRLDDLPAEGAASPVVEPHPRFAFEPRSAAYLIYTSGSSGEPKGVVVERRALAWLADVQCERHRLTARDRLLPLASPDFDLALGETVPFLARGASLVIDDDPLAGGGRALLRRCEETGVSVLQPSTALWHELVAALDAEPEALPTGLRLMVIGTEPFLPARLADWRRAIGERSEIELCNVYGLTEATVDATRQPLAGARRASARHPPTGTPIGRPLPGVRARVLDHRLEPVPPGVPGELCLAGAGLARGYHRRPAATAGRFLPDPGAPRPGGRLLATGDLARFAADGGLILLGRCDRQVKIRGHRVEPGEIEAALATHPRVREAAVTVAAAGSGESRLIAHLAVAGETGPPPETDLRRFLATRLPPELTPAGFVFHDRLPRTTSGKIDRAALALDAGRPRRPADRIRTPPSTPTERALASIWSAVLGIERIGVDDDFFELGGHSLLAIRLMARIAGRWGVELPLTALLERPTVARLAELIDAPERPAPESSPLVLVRSGDEPTRNPLFCIPPAGRYVLCYRPLARHLGAARPIYGLDPRGRDGRRAIDPDVGTMAAAYRRVIQTHRPRGPYLLGGWCTGGVVAWELARQLAADGQPAALVALFDSAAPPRTPPPAPTLPRSANPVARVLLGLGRGLGLRSEELALLLEGKIDCPAAETLRSLSGALSDHGLAAEAVETETLARLFYRLADHPGAEHPDRLLAAGRELGLFTGAFEPARLLRICRLGIDVHRALRRYAPEPYGGRVVLLRTRASAIPDPTLGWGTLATAGVEVIFLPGDHRVLLREPYVGALAVELERRLERWDRRVRTDRRRAASHAG